MATLNPTPPGREHWVVSPQRAALEYTTGYKGSTRNTYAKTIRDWLWWCEDSGLDPWSVSRLHIERWLSTMPNTTASRAATVICGYYRDAHSRGYTPTDLAWGVRRPKTGRGPSGTFATPDELARIIHLIPTIPDTDTQAVITILITCGFRLGETLALNCEDTTIHQGQVFVTLYRKHHHIDVLPLPDSASQLVAQLLHKRSTGPVFRRHNKRMPPAHIRAWVHTLAEQADCEQHLTPHSLRRSFVTFARDLGVDDNDIMAMTGHVDATMLDYYDRGRRQHTGTAARAIDQALHHT